MMRSAVAVFIGENKDIAQLAEVLEEFAGRRSDKHIFSMRTGPRGLR